PTPRLAYCLADCLAECQHEAVAVLDDHLSLAVNPILRTLQDLGTALAEVGGEVVDAVHVQVDIISFAAARDLRFIGAVEVDGNLIAPDNPEHGGRSGIVVHALPIPIARDLESEYALVVLGRRDPIGNAKLR